MGVPVPCPHFPCPRMTSLIKFPLKEKQVGEWGQGPLLDFVSWPLTASYAMTLTSVGPALSLYSVGN